LDFLPFADGTFRAQLKDGSDYRVIGAQMCGKLKPEDIVYGPGYDGS